MEIIKKESELMEFELAKVIYTWKEELLILNDIKITFKNKDLEELKWVEQKARDITNEYLKNWSEPMKYWIKKYGIFKMEIFLNRDKENYVMFDCQPSFFGWQ